MLKEYDSIFRDLEDWSQHSMQLDLILMAKGVSSVALVESAGGKVIPLHFFIHRKRSNWCLLLSPR